MPQSQKSFFPRQLLLALLTLVLGMSSLSKAQARVIEAPIDWQTVRQPLNHALNYCYLGAAGNTGTRVASAVDVINVAWTNQSFFKYDSFAIEIPTSNHDALQLDPKQRQASEFSELKRVFLNRSLASITKAKDLLGRTAAYASNEVREITDATHAQSQSLLNQWVDIAGFKAAADFLPSRVADKAYWDYYGDCEHWNVVLTPVETASSVETASPRNWRVFPFRTVSDFVTAKLNSLTSNLRHFTKFCLKQVEPEFLRLEFDSVEEHDCI